MCYITHSKQGWAYALSLFCSFALCSFALLVLFCSFKKSNKERLAPLLFTKKSNGERLTPLFFSKTATEIGLLPSSFKKEQLRVACSLTLYKKSIRKRFAQKPNERMPNPAFTSTIKEYPYPQILPPTDHLLLKITTSTCSMRPTKQIR